MRPRPDMAPHPDDPVGGALPGMDHRMGGRKPCQYTASMGDLILARLAGGWTVDRICADPHMPSRRTLYDWMERNPEFEDGWRDVRRLQAAARRHLHVRREDARRVAREAAVEAGRPPPGKRGRKSSYTPERGRAFCELVWRGLTLRRIARIPGQPAVAMVYRWLRNHPEFRHDYVLALRLREDALIDRMLDRGRGVTLDGLPAARLACWNLKGRIGRLRPQVWME